MTATENVSAGSQRITRTITTAHHPDTTGSTDTAVRTDTAEPSLDLLTVSEVAAILRLSKMTIYRLMDQGSLPALRVGRSFRIPRDSLRSLVEASTGSA